MKTPFLTFIIILVVLPLSVFGQEQFIITPTNELTEAEIERYMRMDTIEEILGNSVEYVKYDSDKGKTNFKELVYQEQLNSTKRKPVLVLFYDNQNKGTFSKSSAILMKFITIKYANKIKLLAYDVSIEPDYSGQPKFGIFGKEIKSEHIKGIPSIAMYSKYDLTKSENFNNNNGKIKQIDIIKSGPKDTQANYLMANKGMPAWIDTNILQPNQEWCWRLNNSWDNWVLSKY